MSVLVTGGAGYIGSHMVHALVDGGESVVAIDDLSTGFIKSLPPHVPLVVGNIGDSNLVSAVIAEHKVEAIIHFAGSIVVPDSVADPLGYYNNNTSNSRTLIEAAVKGGVQHFIFSSTAAVYGDPIQVPVSEDMPTQPMSPYGRSKLMTEWMLQDASKAHDLRFTALRYFNVAGADPLMRTGQSTPAATHLIKVAVQTALGMRHSVQVYGNDFPTPDGTGVRDYIHVSDLAYAHAHALRYLRDGGRSAIFNCGYGHGFSVLEVIEMVKRVSGVNFKVEMAPRRAGDPAQIIAAPNRISATLGWTPRFDDLEIIVSHALAWEKLLAQAR
jgi:UDP-glucose 4-epimerase